MIKSMLMGSLFLACAVVACAEEEAKSRADVAYARPELLIETEDLGRRLLSSQVQTIVLDVRSREAYDKGHIPAAIWVDLAEWKKTFGNGQDKVAWSERISKVGIGPNTPVVVYDEALTGSAARVWWILTYWGVDEAAILNGGMKVWEGEGRPIDTDIPATPANVFQAKPQRDRLTTYDELKDQLKDQSKFQLLDVRTAEEFQAGKISTCTHFDWQELVDSKTGKLLPAAKLQAKLKEAGFDADRPVVTYCQSGGRASVMAFALELMGADEVANYHGSWGD